MKELYPACKPVLIYDSYYLDKEHYHIKKKLNAIANSTEHYNSKDQHFKSDSEIKKSFYKLFKDDSGVRDQLWEESVSNALKIANKCNFEIYSDTLHIPNYKMTKQESKKYVNNEDLFDALIEKGIKSIKRHKDEAYINRVKEEKQVIKKGGFVDYFLILVDVYNYAKKENIYTGIGRGSIGGSLVAYCLGLIKIDPIEYDLLFSRFLNEARILKETKKDVIVIKTDEGEEVYLPNKELKVLRDSKELTILAKNIKEKDEILS